MPNASRVILNEIDNTFSPADVALGIKGIIGVFKRGPVNDASILLNSPQQFFKIFGAPSAGTDDAQVVKRCFERGASLRVVRITHYTDINAGTNSATKSTPATTKTYLLSAVLVTGNTASVTINGTTITQLFTTNSENTIALLIAKINSTMPPGVIVKAVYVANSLKFHILPVTGVTLTVTGSVTGGATQATVTIGSVTTISNATPVALFSFAPKYPGSDYNNIEIDVVPASNGNANYFDVNISHLLEPALNEQYKNLIIIGNPTVNSSSYLQAIVNGSALVNVTYNDLSGTSGQQVPVPTYLKYDTGSNGGSIVDADYIGASSSKTGLYAFDGYDDMFDIAALTSSGVVHQGGAAYAENRKDLVYFAHLDNSYITESALAAAKDALLIDSTYIAFYAGGLTISDPFTGLPVNINEIGDVLGAAAYSDETFGPWFSFAGPKRGILFNALGIVNNFGLPSNYAGRNLLANHQINLVINTQGKLQISGNFTGQLAQSHLSYLNVRRMLIYLKKLLGPILANYIEDPNDPITWRKIFLAVTPSLKALKDKRGIYDYDWQGDQFVSDITKVVINNTTDIGLGKYYVKLFIKDIVSLQIIQVDITLTPSGVSFEDNLSTIANQA